MATNTKSKLERLRCAVKRIEMNSSEKNKWFDDKYWEERRREKLAADEERKKIIFDERRRIYGRDSQYHENQIKMKEKMKAERTIMEESLEKIQNDIEEICIKKRELLEHGKRDLDRITRLENIEKEKVIKDSYKDNSIAEDFKHLLTEKIFEKDDEILKRVQENNNTYVKWLDDQIIEKKLLIYNEEQCKREMEELERYKDKNEQILLSLEEERERIRKIECIDENKILSKDIRYKEVSGIRNGEIRKDFFDYFNKSSR
ncbi:MAG: hypothetical protein MHMPM18_000649 [Marteilia pararefringens]